MPDPDFTSSKSVSARILENTFGDGYTQRAADGLNAIRDAWSVSYTNLTTPEKNILETLLLSAAGWQAFWWVAMGETVAKKWTCKEWKFVPVAAGYWNMSGTFIQSFDN